MKMVMKMKKCLKIIADYYSKEYEIPERF